MSSQRRPASDSQPRASPAPGSGGMDYQFRQKVASHHEKSASLKSGFFKLIIFQSAFLLTSLWLVKLLWKESLIILLLISAAGNMLSLLLGYCGRSKTSTILMRINSVLLVTVGMSPLILFIFLLVISPKRTNTSILVIINSIIVIFVDMFGAVYSRMMANCWNGANEYKRKKST